MNEHIQQVLEENFGYDSFRGLQEEIIQTVLNHQDCLAILPTGTGKSLCYQLPGVLLEGMVIIVSPLLSLMEDQVNGLLQMKKFSAVAINSLLTKSEREYVLTHLSEYQYIYLSPEMLSQSECIQALSRQKIALFVIDEAHCLSQWGVDFRPEYRNLKWVKKQLHDPTTLALTASAPPKVKAEIQELLLHPDAQVFELPVNRPNIYLQVEKTNDKEAVLLKYLKELSGSGIIYCATRVQVEELYERLKKDYSIGYYHGGLSSNQRRLLQTQFQKNQLQLLVATNAFGMGINKPDIRFVIHYDLPDNLESYVQEIGRAGRDGEPSIAILFYQNHDEQIHYYMQNQTRNEREVFELLDVPKNGAQKYFSELQQKWFRQIQREDYYLFMEEIKANEKVKQAQLQTMLSYIHTNQCRRDFIAQYFENPLPDKQALCCDNHGPFDYQLLVNSNIQNEKIANWQEVLLKIF